MPIILHLETATDICSVCVSDGSNVLALQENKDGYSHAAKITILIDEVLKAASLTFKDLSAVALSQGPGSYTSLRVGTSAAKAICYAWQIPLIAVDTLRSLALAAAKKAQLKQKGFCIPLIDARRMEAYTAIFDENNNVVTPTHAKIIEEGAFTELLTDDNVLLFSGNGLEKCKPLLQHPQMAYSDVLCSSVHLVEPALNAYQKKEFVDTAYFSPSYFKSPNITASKKNIL